MSLNSIRKALERRIETLPGKIATVAEGTTYNPIVDVPYQELILMPAVPENPTFGDGYYRENGNLRVRLFFPNKRGVGAIIAYAESIRLHFQRATTLVEDGIEVIIRRTPAISGTQKINDRITMTVDINYFASVLTDQH